MQQLSCSSFATGTAPLHLYKNRYSDCLPLESSRVKLSNMYSQDGTDYINANWVRGTEDGATYIATQAPLPWTFGDFWGMLFTEDCKLVVCLTKLVEQGILKAHQYWPENVGEVQTYGFLDVEFKKSMDMKHITIRNFEVRSRVDGTCKEIVQLHYTEWPDYGVPDVASFVRLIELMKVYMVGENPVVAVHCSAGVGLPEFSSVA
jgi:protein tyrosine phosphatase